MSNTELTSKLLQAIEAGDTETAKSCLSDDFQFSGPVPEPIGADMWLGLHGKLRAGFSDFSFNAREPQETPDGASVTLKLSGTHDGNLDLTPMGMQVFPPTNKSLDIPEENCTITIHDGKITSFQVDAGPDGGLKGILKSIGAEMPAPPA